MVWVTVLLLDGDEVVAVINPDRLRNRVLYQLDPVRQVHLLVPSTDGGGLVLHLLEEDGQVQAVGDVLLELHERHPSTFLDGLHGSDLEPPGPGAENPALAHRVLGVDLVRGGRELRHPYPEERFHQPLFLNRSSADRFPVRKDSLACSEPCFRAAAAPLPSTLSLDS